jgi:hypothetical protein
MFVEETGLIRAHELAGNLRQDPREGSVGIFRDPLPVHVIVEKAAI